MARRCVLICFFFFNDTATTEIYTLSLHDALPICCREMGGTVGRRPDDDPEKLATRWSEFLEQTQPVIKQYREQGILKEVDGMRSVAEVHEEMMRIINFFQGSES